MISITSSKANWNFLWLDHQTCLTSVIQILHDNESHFDCELVAEGQRFPVHRLVVSSCSPLLRTLLSTHTLDYPIITITGVTADELHGLITYMYTGEVAIDAKGMMNFFSAAKLLAMPSLVLTFQNNSSDPHKLKHDFQNEVDEEISEIMVLDDEENADIKEEEEDRPKSPNHLNSIKQIIIPETDLSTFYVDDNTEYICVDEETVIDANLSSEQVSCDDISKEKKVKDEVPYSVLKEDEVEETLGIIETLEDEEDVEESVEVSKEELFKGRKQIRLKNEHVVMHDSRSVTFKKDHQKMITSHVLKPHMNRLSKIKQKKTVVLKEEQRQDASGMKVYQCAKCGNRYSHRRTLLHHMHWICEQPPTYSCNLCSYMGKRKFQLKSHLRHAHMLK